MIEYAMYVCSACSACLHIHEFGETPQHFGKDLALTISEFVLGLSLPAVFHL